MTKRPLLVIVSERTRDHFHLPLRYFKKFRIIHLYSSAFKDSHIVTPGVEAIQYYSLSDLTKKLIELKPDYVQGLEPYYGYSRIKIPLKVMWRLYAIHRYVKKYQPIFFFHVLENQTPNQKYGWLAGPIMKRVFNWYAQPAQFVFYANQGAKRNCLVAGVPTDQLFPSVWGFWGVDEKLFKPLPPSPQPSVIFIGTLNRQKGIVKFIELVKNLETKISHLKVTIVGDGPESGLVKKSLIGRNNWQWFSRITYQELPKILAPHWLLITPAQDLPYSAEQVSLTNLEALSCGVPIRGFKSGSAAEFLPQNGAVELVEDQNLDQLETQVVDYLKAKSTHLKTRQLARDWTLNNFNIEKNIAEIENFFFPAQPGLIFTKATRSIGGGEIQTINLAQELIKQHQRVAVITNTDSPIKAIASKMSVESLDLGPEATSRYSILYFLLFSWHNQAPAKKLLRNLYSQGFRILVCQSINEKIILSPIAQRLGFRVIWLDFQLLLPWLPQNPLFSRLKNASKYVDRILTTSHYLQTQHEKLGLGKVTVIPPGISLPTKGTRKAYDAQNVVIGLVGRLHSEKGFDNFLKALKGLPETVRAIIVGDGPQRGELEDLTAKLGLKNRVEFRGFIQDTGSIYQQFDIFCQPSRRDNTPLTVLEAMAQGLPIVASRVGAIGEIVGEAGVMIVPDNVQALTQALTKLINNPNQLQIMSQKSLKQAQKFSISNMAQDFYAQASAGHSLS